MNWPVPQWDLRAPTWCEPHPWKLPRAVSLSLFRPPKAELADEREEESAESCSLPQHDDDLLKRLMSVLQAPLFLDCQGSVVEWPFPLLAYQQAGIATLMRSPQLLLADDMGLGKTIQAIGAMRMLFLSRQIESALVVCPSSVLRQWAQELAIWGRELSTVVMAGPFPRRALWRRPAHVRLVSYETLRSDLQLALRTDWGVLVLDEASRIKNREASVAQACKRLTAQRRWALTGTPLENSVEDVISILEFLGGPRAFQSRSQVLDRLREVQLRRRKEEVLRQLPPRLVREVEIELGPAQMRAYLAAEQSGVVQLRAQGPALRVTHILELVTRLKQICNRDPVSGESAKLDDLAVRLEVLVAEGHRALVFSQFTDAQFGVGLVCQALERFRPLAYTGSMSAAQRSQATDRFLQEPAHRVLVLSLRAGGVGLNLQSASYVFHLDRWWNPAIEEQADSRAHRMGQQHPVHAFRYVCLGTIEERIASVLRSKRALFEEIIDDVSLDLAANLTEAELRSLFRL